MTHHTPIRKILCLIGLLCLELFIFPTQAQVNISKALSREKELQHASTASDSIRILLDVYSLSDKINRDRLRVQLIKLAENTDNNEIIGDVLKELASSTDDTGELARLIEISESIPDNTEKEQLRTVLVMEQVEAEAYNKTDSYREQQMMEYARQGMGMNGDPYKEIQNIYRAMVYLGTYSQGPLYFEYIKRLEELVNELPEEDYAIKNLFYTTAAIFYTRKRDYKRAIEFDRKLISELDKLSSKYTDPKQAENDLDYFYYVSYRRMLRNFKGLTPAEIEEAYNQCLNLAKRNAQAAEALGNAGLANSYYFMATHQYAKAVPELQKALNAENISDFRKGELLGHLAYAMRKTGNKTGELDALREYSAMLLKDRAKMRDNMYREIELRNSVNKVLFDEFQQKEITREENRVMRKTSLTLVYVLAVILIFMCQAYMRLRHKVKELEAKNNKLHRNIEHIFDDGVPQGATALKLHKPRLKG